MGPANKLTKEHPPADKEAGDQKEQQRERAVGKITPHKEKGDKES